MKLKLLIKMELQLLGKMGTPTFGEDGTPGLGSLASGLHLFCKMAQWTEGRVYFVIKQEIHGWSQGLMLALYLFIVGSSLGFTFGLGLLMQSYDIYLLTPGFLNCSNCLRVRNCLLVGAVVFCLMTPPLDL